MNQQNRKLEYTFNHTVPDLFVGPGRESSFVISGRVYSYYTKRLFRKPKKEYTYTLNVPYMRDPFYDGEFSTNRILGVHADMVRQILIDKIEELKNENN